MIRTIPSLLLLGTLAVLALAAPPLSAQAGANDVLMNPNLATAEDLGGVEGLSAEAVHAIMQGRPFLRPADLHAVLADHVAEGDFEALYGRIWVTLNLNDASGEEILLIPGVGARMLHEFEEYRPYAALAVFQREMGKYVDDAEVARLSQYVFVPININTASEADIMTLPGVGRRMAHEFDEYRPWESFEQFRREIGKYVDEKEVARLERFVVLK